MRNATRFRADNHIHARQDRQLGLAISLDGHSHRAGRISDLHDLSVVLDHAVRREQIQDRLAGNAVKSALALIGAFDGVTNGDGVTIRCCVCEVAHAKECRWSQRRLGCQRRGAERR
jgi:hypothetical protein